MRWKLFEWTVLAGMALLALCIIPTDLEKQNPLTEEMVRDYVKRERDLNEIVLVLAKTVSLHRNFNSYLEVNGRYEAADKEVHKALQKISSADWEPASPIIRDAAYAWITDTHEDRDAVLEEVHKVVAEWKERLFSPANRFVALR